MEEKDGAEKRRDEKEREKKTDRGSGGEGTPEAVGPKPRELKQRNSEAPSPSSTHHSGCKFGPSQGMKGRAKSPITNKRPCSTPETTLSLPLLNNGASSWASCSGLDTSTEHRQPTEGALRRTAQKSIDFVTPFLPPGPRRPYLPGHRPADSILAVAYNIPLRGPLVKAKPISGQWRQCQKDTPPSARSRGPSGLRGGRR